MIRLIILVVCGIIGYSVYTGATSVEEIAETSQQLIHNVARTVANATE